MRTDPAGFRARARSVLRSSSAASRWLGAGVGVAAFVLLDTYGDGPEFAPWLVGFACGAVAYYQSHYGLWAVFGRVEGRYDHYGTVVAGFFALYLLVAGDSLVGSLVVFTSSYLLALVVWFSAYLDVVSARTEQAATAPSEGAEARDGSLDAAEGSAGGVGIAGSVRSWVRESRPMVVATYGTDAAKRFLRGNRVAAWLGGASASVGSWWVVGEFVNVHGVVAWVCLLGVGPLVYYHSHYGTVDVERAHSRVFLLNVLALTVANLLTPVDASFLAAGVTAGAFVTLLEAITLKYHLAFVGEVRGGAVDAGGPSEDDSASGEAGRARDPVWKRPGWEDRRE